MAAVEKRGENSYRLTVSCGYDKEGKKLFKKKTIDLSNIPSKKQLEEAQRQWILFKEEVERGTFLDAGKISFEEFIQKWLIDYAEKNLAPKTLICYRKMLKDRIIPSLGHSKLNKLQPTHLIEFYNNLEESGMRKDGRGDTLSSSTIIKYHRIISSILQDAVQWQYILTNPASRVKPPKLIRKEATAYNEEKTALLISALDAQPLKYKVLVLLALVTGLRRGELVALKWENIDFKNHTIEVKHSAQYLPGEGTTVKEPKTKSSIRKIAVPDSVFIMLKSLKTEQLQDKLKLDESWKGDGWVFTQWDGQLMHVDTPSKWFNNFIKEYDKKIENDDKIKKEDKEKYLLPIINFHCLRHTAATLLINKGLNVRALSSRMGHANTSTTLNIYSHALQSADKQAADIMENIISPQKFKIEQA